MKVRELVKILNRLPQEVELRVKDRNSFSSNFEIVNHDIVLPVDITEYEITEVEHKNFSEDVHFLDDVYIMCDFINLNRQDFLKKYFYITSIQYDITSNLFYNNREHYLNKLYNRLIEIDNEHALYQTKLLENEIVKMQQKRGKKWF